MTNINTSILLCNDVLNTRANMHCHILFALYVAHLKYLSLKYWCVCVSMHYHLH